MYTIITFFGMIVMTRICKFKQVRFSFEESGGLANAYI